MSQGSGGVTSPFALPLHRMGSSSVTPVGALTTHLTFSHFWTDAQHHHSSKPHAPDAIHCHLGQCVIPPLCSVPELVSTPSTVYSTIPSTILSVSKPNQRVFLCMGVGGLRSPAPGSGTPHWNLEGYWIFCLSDICWAYSVMHTPVVAWKLGHVLFWLSKLTDLGIWREIKSIFMRLQHWSCVVLGEFIVYLHFLCVPYLQDSNHWELELLKLSHMKHVCFIW